MKVVIVGGVAGGASAAARLRRLDENARIVMFERTGYVSYANCGLPYYIGGVIKDKEDLTLQTPQSFKERFDIDVRVLTEVVSIDRAAKKVAVRDLTTGATFEESYDKLILSPGARPVVPDVKGADSDKIYTLRTVEDTFRIRDAAISKGVRSAVVIGGGFIGIETAENLREAGLYVTLVQRSGHVLSPIDGDIASFLHNRIRKFGVDLRLNSALLGFEEEGGRIRVLLKDGQQVEADMAVLAIGVAPESALAKEAGLEIGVKGSIVVNDRMQTSDPDIYAVGDAVSITNTVTGGKAVISLAGPANKQGRVAADNIAGVDHTYKGSHAASVLKVFDMTAAFVGINEKTAKAAGIDYDKIIISPASHASYYPGGKVMTVKVLFTNTDRKIIGAQAVGFDGVDTRIDVIATAMQAGMKVTDLADLDLAYAPPYASAKDPVNMVGFVAENVLEGKVKQFYYEDLPSLKGEDVTLLDVRTEEEYARGHAEGFNTNIPVDELRDRASEIDRSKPLYLMCQSGLRSYIACRMLMQKGFDCYNFAGGYRLYSSIAKSEFDSACATDCGVNRAK